MMDLFGLLITIIILGLVFYLIFWIVTQIPLPPPFKTVATVLIGLIAVVMLLGLLFGGITIPVVRLRS